MIPPSHSVSTAAVGQHNVVDVEPEPLYYVVVDGTAEVDSVLFGAALETRFGWKNLFDNLPPHPKDASYVYDPGHPFLLLKKAKNELGGAPVIVATPCGDGGHGHDAPWADYSNESPPDGRETWKTGANGEFDFTTSRGEYTCYGRHTAVWHSIKMVKSLLLHPATRRIQLEDGTQADSLLEYGANPLFARRTASFVQFSSHGWLSGMMSGEAMSSWSGASPAPARDPFFRYWLTLGKIQHLTFRGPLWVVLAQCSTVNSSCWAMWARMMAGSAPVVRGILGYEEASPDAYIARGIANTFMEQLAAGKTFLDAWKVANRHGGPSALPWAAVVHRDAVDDKMKDFRAFTALTARPPSDLASPASYRGYLRSIPDGEDVYDRPPPFTLALWFEPPSQAGQPAPPRMPVNAQTLGDYESRLFKDGRWQIVVCRTVEVAGAPVPKREAILSLKITMIHIRPSYSSHAPFSPLFDVAVDALSAGGRTSVTPKLAANVLSVTAPDATTMLEVNLRCDREPTSVPPLECDHSYLWWRVSLTTESGTYDHDFRTQGLLC